MKHLRTWIGAAALAVAALLFSATARAAPTFPALTGRVVDDAHILSDSTRAQLTQKLAALEDATTRQLVVVTLPSLQDYDIADYGYQLGRTWGIGQKGENNGVLFIVAPNERAVRIEVGYGLEPILTDALSNQILQQAVLPRFRAGDMERGVIDGTNALIEQLSLGEAAATARAQEAKEQQNDKGVNPFFVLVMIFIFLSVFRGLFGRRSSGLWWLPFLFMGGGGRGGWGGGGGFGGGGFGGGGGSFGGGGASGRW